MSKMLAILSGAGFALCVCFLGLAYLIGGDNVFHDSRSMQSVKPLLDMATRKEWRWQGGDTLALDAPVNVRYEPRGAPGVSVTGPAELMEHVRVGEGRIVSDSPPRQSNSRKMEAVISGVPIRKFVVNGGETLQLGHIDQQAMEVHINGNGTVTGDGTVERLKLVIAGSGNADLGKLSVTDDAKVSILGNGTASLSPHGELRLFIAGNGKLSLLSKPRSIRQTILGSGNISPAPPMSVEPTSAPMPAPLPPEAQTRMDVQKQVQMNSEIQTQESSGNYIVKGSHNVDFGHIKQQDAKISVLHSGSVTAEGNVDDLTVNVMGSGKANLGKLSVRKLKVTVAGSGDATIAPTEEVKITIMGSGSVRLLTKPAKIERTIMGSGRIIEAD
jgi:hypothetical protein